MQHKPKKTGGARRNNRSRSVGPRVYEGPKEGHQVGVIMECLPNTMFRVSFTKEDQEGQLAYLSGKMRRFRIRILVGDRVEVKIDEYGGKGRITKRL